MHRRALATTGIALAAVIVAFFLIRLLGAPWPNFSPTYPDSFSYLKVATRGPLQPHFYFDERPIGYPFLLWTVGRSSTLAIVAQTLIYVAAFVLLSGVILRIVRSRTVAVVVLVFVAAVAIEPRNAMWNTLLLSESLSTSMSVVSIAAWLYAAARPSKRSIIAAWIATALWILVRDTNVLPTIAVIVPAALVCAFVMPQMDRALRRRLIGGAIAIIPLCGYVYVAQAVTLRNQYPMNNNVGMRILPDPATTKFFVQGGMPLDDALRARTGHNSWDDNEAFLDAPNLKHYREWARGAGTRRLMISMLALAPTWWDRFHHELPHILGDPNQNYDSYKVFNRFPHHFPPPFGEPRTNGALFAELLLAIAALVYGAFNPRRRLLVFATSALFVSALLDVWCSYIGDAMEVNRHLVGPLVRLNVCVLVAVAVGVDSAVSRFRDRAPKQAAIEAPVLEQEMVSADA